MTIRKEAYTAPTLVAQGTIEEMTLANLGGSVADQPLSTGGALLSS